MSLNKTAEKEILKEVISSLYDNLFKRLFFLNSNKLRTNARGEMSTELSSFFFIYLFSL